MTLTVAIASEFDDYDGRVYQFLLEQLLGVPIARWTGTFVFSGCRSVVKLAPAFLAAAEAARVSHALLAIDNDGGAKRSPEHDATHVIPPFTIDGDDGCRECWLQASLPPAWKAGGGKACVVVPVQVLETWLLVLRGDSLGTMPERVYGRNFLKRLFFGKPTPPAAARLELALAELGKPNALGVLRARQSFQRFESQLVHGWR